MPNKNYAKGVRFEREVKASLEAAGWWVLRTAGSHGFADLVAISKESGAVVFIQCKKVGTINEANSLLKRVMNLTTKPRTIFAVGVHGSKSVTYSGGLGPSIPHSVA